jgi:hypothetical protein
MGQSQAGQPTTGNDVAETSLRQSEELLPPIAVLPDPDQPRLSGDATAIDVESLLASLAALDAFGVGSARITAARRIVDIARTQAKLLSARGALQDSVSPPRSIAQKYFRVRTAALSRNHALHTCVRIVGDLAEDLTDAPLCGSDLTRLVRALSEVLQVAAEPGPADHTTPAELQSRLEFAIEEVWLRRWIIGHQGSAGDVAPPGDARPAERSCPR